MHSWLSGPSQSIRLNRWVISTSKSFVLSKRKKFYVLKLYWSARQSLRLTPEKWGGFQAPTLQERCPNPRAEPENLSSFCSGCPHWKKYSNWFYRAAEPFPTVQRAVVIQNIPVEDNYGYPHGLYFTEDNKSWCCLQVSQASWWSSLLRPSRSAAPVSSLKEGFPSKELILCTTSVSAGYRQGHLLPFTFAANQNFIQILSL